MKNNTFYSNTAQISGGAIKLLFYDSDFINELLDQNIFANNTDLNNQTISDGRPSYYQFSFYNGLSKNLATNATGDLNNAFNTPLTVENYFHIYS